MIWLLFLPVFTLYGEFWLVFITPLSLDRLSEQDSNYTS